MRHGLGAMLDWMAEIGGKGMKWLKAEKRRQKGRKERGESQWETSAGVQNRLTGSIAAKCIAFFLLAGSAFIGLGTAFLTLYMGVCDFYTQDLDGVLMRVLDRECRNMTYVVEHLIEDGKTKRASEMLLQSNMDLELIQEENSGETVIWKSERMYESDLTMDLYISFTPRVEKVRLNGVDLEAEEIYLYRVWLNPDFPEADSFRAQAEWVRILYENRYHFIWFAAAGVILCLVCFVFLMCSAGHRNGQEGIMPGVLTTIPLDVLTVLFLGGAAVTCFFTLSIGAENDMILVLLMTLEGTVLAVWFTFFFMDFAVRAKRGNCWRYSLIYMIWRGLRRAVCFLGRQLAALIRGVPLVLTTLIVYFGLCIVEMIVVMQYTISDGVMLWAMEKALLLPFILYIALTCKKLLTASSALAEGKGDYQVDTSRMWGDFKAHGENLNSLGQGISRAVAERMKSERLKTELISNVSHDLKTPLTSIINYADLIYEETQGAWKAQEQSEEAGQILEAAGPDREKIEEYAEVLLRQSRRLKKLLEDLVDASKATTGNLEVNLVPCEVGVLLSQAVGEYQQRMAEKALELVVRQPEEPVNIMADGRHLWRVFDNLLNNICKYAQENSRVYLSVEKKQEQILVVFRNMSKYPLDISAEELEERFVRGDKSRHMEGNGLGLSIAKSLVELQNGRMEIVIDGDLFKAILGFPQSGV